MNKLKFVLISVVILGIGLWAYQSNGQFRYWLKGAPKAEESSTKNSENNGVEFGKTVSLSVNDKVIFTDGFTITLKYINDSRCPKDVQCIWAGELGGTFLLSGGKLTELQEINLGTSRNKSALSYGYSITLVSATEESVVIMVNN